MPIRGASCTRRLSAAVWLLTTDSIPIPWRWVIGDGVLHQGVIAGAILQAAAVLAIGYQARACTVLRIAVVVMPLSWLIPMDRSTTGFPFGADPHRGARSVDRRRARRDPAGPG